VAGTAATAAGMVALGTVAWACTQRVGTFTICSPPSKTYVSTRCTKVTGTTQAGNLNLGIDDTDPALFSARAANFKSKNYQVTFNKAGSTADCHRTNNLDTVILTATDGTSKFKGPSWYKTFNLPDQGSALGKAKVCTQDVPDVVTGQVLSVTVI
jgi:hypothetical protein